MLNFSSWLLIYISFILMLFIEFFLGQFHTFCVQHTPITVTPPSLFSLFYSYYLSSLKSTSLAFPFLSFVFCFEIHWISPGFPAWLSKYPLEVGGLLSVYTCEEDASLSLQSTRSQYFSRERWRKDSMSLSLFMVDISRSVVGSHTWEIISALAVPYSEDSIHCLLLVFRLFISFPHPLLPWPLNLAGSCTEVLCRTSSHLLLALWAATCLCIYPLPIHFIAKRGFSDSGWR